MLKIDLNNQKIILVLLNDAYFCDRGRSHPDFLDKKNYGIKKIVHLLATSKA